MVRILLIAMVFLVGSPVPAFGKMPKTGKKAPDFSATGDSGEKIRLSDFLGKWVVLYFYPKDDTPGCIIEAKSFRDLVPEFKKHQAVVIGVSYDGIKAHQDFKKGYDLTFLLLADENHQISELYGVSGPFFAARTTFLISPVGELVKIYPNVNPSHHGSEVLADLKVFQQSPATELPKSR